MKKNSNDMLREIRELFASVGNGRAHAIKSAGAEYPAWVVRMSGFYGVGVPYPSESKVSERFSNVKLKSERILIDGEEKHLLLLVSTLDSLRYEFSAICAEFADPGDGGSEREALVSSPSGWWGKWRSLMGNSVKQKTPYAALGELLVYSKALEAGKPAKWGGAGGGTHDIESEGESFEVKSTTSRYESTVTISSQHQLLSGSSRLWLVLCRFEKSEEGFSIEDMVRRAVKAGADSAQVESSLERLGFEEGSSARLEKYKLLEIRKYPVDESFPKITLESFKGNRLPDAVVGMTYSIDLSGLEYEIWD